MFCLAYTSAASVFRNATLPLTFALALTVSHQAMAACVLGATAGTVVDCSGDDSELPASGIPSVAIVNGATSPQIGVRLTTDGTEFENSTTITSQVTDPTGRNTYNVFGVAANPPPANLDDSEWEIENEGSITAVHYGIGQLAAIGILQDAGEATIENSGTISITRGSFTLANNSASSLTATTTAGTGTLGNAAAVWVQEEENESLTVENSGTISATGKLTAGIQTRGAFFGLENEETGVISASGVGSVAVSSNNGTDQEDEDGLHHYFIGNTIIVNEGKILGDTVSQGAAAIQVVDANGLRYQASRVNEGTGAGYDPLTLTSQAGRRDSTIINSGTISGDIYLGAGNHLLVNTDEGEMSGNIDVDQRRNFTYTVNNPSNLPLIVYRAGEGPSEDDDDDDDGGSTERTFSSIADFLAAVPDHYFEFDNAAPVTGNVTVHTNVSGLQDSKIVLKPHITGSGIGSDIDNPSENSGFIEGTLAIGFDGATPNGRNVTVSNMQATTTITPVIDSVVHSGEWFLVARDTLQTGDDKPDDRGRLLPRRLGCGNQCHRHQQLARHRREREGCLRGRRPVQPRHRRAQRAACHGGRRRPRQRARSRRLEPRGRGRRAQSRRAARA